MTVKPEKKSKTALRKQFYSVSVMPVKSRQPGQQRTEKVMDEVQALAAAKGFDDVTVRTDGESMTRLGIFFMSATEAFADEVRKLASVKSVEKPIEKKSSVGNSRPRRR